MIAGGTGFGLQTAGVGDGVRRRLRLGKVVGFIGDSSGGIGPGLVAR